MINSKKQFQNTNILEDLKHDNFLEDDNVYADAYLSIRKKNIQALNEHITELDKVLSPKQLDFAIEKYGEDIATNEKCSEKIRKLILEKNPQNLSLMKNPSVSLQEFAFKKDYTVLPYLTIDITEDMAIKALSIKPTLLKYIKNPTLNMKNVAVSIDPYCIEYIEKPSKDLQILAIQKNPRVINYIKNPTYEIQEYALEVFKREKDVKEFYNLKKGSHSKGVPGMSYKADVYSSVSPFYKTTKGISPKLKIEAKTFNMFTNAKFALEDKMIKMKEEAEIKKRLKNLKQEDNLER